MTTTCELIRQDANHTDAYDITSLRQDEAVTVRLVKSSKDRATACQRSKQLRLDHVTSRTGRLSTSCPANSFSSQEQLPEYFKPHTQRDTEKPRVRKQCCCNYHRDGSSLIPSIRQHTSSPQRHNRTSLVTSSLPSLKDHLIIVFILILAFSVSCISAVSSSSEPLTRTEGNFENT